MVTTLAAFYVVIALNLAKPQGFKVSGTTQIICCVIALYVSVLDDKMVNFLCFSFGDCAYNCIESRSQEDNGHQL